MNRALSLSGGSGMNCVTRRSPSPAGRRYSSSVAAAKLGLCQIDADDFLNAIQGGNRADVHQYMQSLMRRVSLKHMVDKAGNTPLHVAVSAARSQGRTDIFTALVQYPIIRALVVAQNNDQKTPLDVANEWPDSQIKDVIVAELKVIGNNERDSASAEDDVLGEMALKVLLANPRAELTADERLACLSYCMALGQRESKKVAGKSLVLLIGNTGSGKSTLANYLAGCDMTIEYSGLDERIVVKPDSQQPMVTEIGHGREFTTFLPKFVGDDEWVYCDCPGFLDNRGAEINIANAVNIRQMVAAADCVKVVVLVEYGALTHQRGSGVDKTMTMVTNLLGGIDSLKSHLNAIIMSVTKLPYNAAVNLANVKVELMRSCNNDTMGILAERLVIFDPLNREMTDGQTRDALRHTIHHKLTGITDLDGLFNIQLLPSDKAALSDIVNEIRGRIHTGLSAENYDDVRFWLEAIDQLNRVENDYVRRLTERVFGGIKTYQKDDHYDVANCVGEGRIHEGELIIDRMARRADGLRGYASLMDLDDMHLEAISVLDKKKKQNLELARQTADLQKMQETEKATERERERMMGELAQVESKHQQIIETTINGLREEMSVENEKHETKKIAMQERYEQSKAALEVDRIHEEKVGQDRLNQIQLKLDVLEKREKQGVFGHFFGRNSGVEEQKEEMEGEISEQVSAVPTHVPVVPRKGLLGVQDEAGLYRELGYMYAGSKEWGKLGIKVERVPEISEGMKVALEEMRGNGEAPLVVLDIGIDLVGLHKILESKAGKGGVPSNAKLCFWGDDSKKAFEESEKFAKEEGVFQYLVVATGKGTSETGVFDSLRGKSYDSQQKELKERYAGYEQMRVREVVVMEILGQLANGKRLLSDEERAVEGLGGRKCQTWARTSEKWAKNGCRGLVGAHGARGLLVNSYYDGHEYDFYALAVSRKFPGH
jgi:energy-coupling factor transporter ATP-binding protein EcfA2